MLRIIDARTGEPVDAAPARRGLTRVEVHAPGFDTSNLRVLLVADLLVRALEMGGTPVWALLTGEHQQAELRAGAAALGVRPFEDSQDVSAGLGEAQVIHVVREGGTTPDGVRVAVAPAHPGVPGTPGAGQAVTPGGPDAPVASRSGAPVTPGASAAPGAPRTPRPSGAPRVPGVPDSVDPTVLRLALLSRRRSEPVRLGTDVLRDAEATLARWRRAVAAWAHRPSRPIPDEVRGQLRGAWEDDLDAPGVLRVLSRVETAPDLPDGARFETYAYADRLLGLELTRDLGSRA